MNEGGPPVNDDCIFCKIVAGKIPAEKIYEDTDCLVFKDINPKAPTHLLVIPKEHFASVNDIPASKMDIMGKLFAVVQKVTKKTGVDTTGYRTIINHGPSAGQEVFHLHLHIIGGRRLGPMA